MSMSWPAPVSSPTSARRPPFLTGGPNGGAGRPSRTWASGSSAAARSCRTQSAPGMPGRTNGIAAGNAAPALRTPRTRSAWPERDSDAGRKNPAHRTRHRVQQTGRSNGVPDTVLTSTSPRMRLCSALSRSFLLGGCLTVPCPAGTPSGQRPRFGVYMAANEKRDRQDQSNRSVHAFRGTPGTARQGASGVHNGPVGCCARCGSWREP